MDVIIILTFRAISFTLYLGGLAAENDEEEEGLTVTTTEYFRHPDYDSTNFNNDIALIHLREPIEYNGKIFFIIY